MNDLTEKHCEPCEGGVPPMTEAEVNNELTKLDNWHLNSDSTQIHKRFEFKNFYRTMSFVNAIAWIANQENHHPDMEVGYNYCKIHYKTHAISGLSINDFICAAKIDSINTL